MDFRAFCEFCFFFRYLLTFDVIFINTSLVSSNYAFDKCWVLSYVVKHFFSTRPHFCKRFGYFSTNLSLPRFICKTLTKMCWVDTQELLKFTAISLMSTRWFSCIVSLSFSMLLSINKDGWTTCIRQVFDGFIMNTRVPWLVF